MYLSIRILLIISLGFGANYFHPDLYTLSRGQESFRYLNIPDTLKLVGIMAQFPIEIPDNPKTSGDGNFLILNHEEYSHFYDSNTPRCEGFLVDRPPHDSLYFQKQLEAVGNYYNNVSNGKLPYTANIIMNLNSSDNLNGYYTVSDSMEYYAKADTSLARLFSEVLNIAKTDIELYLTKHNNSSDEVVFIVFHAGLSQDFSYPSLDPTIYDLKSAYIERNMFIDKETNIKVIPTIIAGDSIYTGVLLPETQNIIYYDVVEDIFGNPDYFMHDQCDIQIGLTGIFAFLLGYELGLPEMFSPSTFESGIGYFGLMDHGSNNGRGVIPAPPSPWTRSLLSPAWSTINKISPLQNTEYEYTLHALNINNQLFRVDISDNEYFIIENRNNWVYQNTDIDSIRRKNKIDEKLGHWFDSVIEEFPESKIQIDEKTQVITGFDHYDYGLPGSGILIWHIKEPDPSIYHEGVNNDLHNRHIQIEEADGAQDIGTRSYAFFASDDPTTGTQWDLWFLGNEGYEYANNGMDNQVIFDNASNPNTRTTEGAETFISIEILSEISDAITIRIKFKKDKDIEIVNLSDATVQYLGNSYDEEDSTAALFYEKEGIIYKESSDSVIVQIDTLNYTEGNVIYTYQAQIEYLEAENCIHPLCEDEIFPLGYIDSDTITIHVPEALSLGDLDKDGLDEIITIEDGNIYARNGNETQLNGFPVEGEFTGVPLIANILPPTYANKDEGKPEIICREGNDIIILSNRGARLRQLSSFDADQPLAMIPFWRGDTTMALIDGSRLFLFDLDMDHSYWLNPRSQPSGFPLSTGKHKLNTSRKLRKQAYNYPNPIIESETTFRFYVSNTETSEIKIKIYNAAGYLIKDDLIQDNITHHEFNEIKWDNIHIDAGLYLAEIKPDVGRSELVRLVVIK